MHIILIVIYRDGTPGMLKICDPCFQWQKTSIVICHDGIQVRLQTWVGFSFLHHPFIRFYVGIFQIIFTGTTDGITCFMPVVGFSLHPRIQAALPPHHRRGPRPSPRHHSRYRRSLGHSCLRILASYQRCSPMVQHQHHRLNLQENPLLF